MIRIKLFCASGMSTSLLVKKMKEAADKKGIECTIAAYSESLIASELDGCDVALLGPQVGYLLNKTKTLCEPKGIPVGVIPMVAYGIMDGEKALDYALGLKK